MDGLFYYNAMWGTRDGNISYELAAEGGRDLLPLQMHIQRRCTQLYAESRDLMDGYGGRKPDMSEPFETTWKAPLPPEAGQPV